MTCNIKCEEITNNEIEDSQPPYEGSFANELAMFAPLYNTTASMLWPRFQAIFRQFVIDAKQEGRTGDKEREFEENKIKEAEQEKEDKIQAAAEAKLKDDLSAAQRAEQENKQKVSTVKLQQLHCG